MTCVPDDETEAGDALKFFIFVFHAIQANDSFVVADFLRIGFFSSAIVIYSINNRHIVRIRHGNFADAPRLFLTELNFNVRDLLLSEHVMAV